MCQIHSLFVQGNWMLDGGWEPRLLSLLSFSGTAQCCTGSREHVPPEGMSGALQRKAALEVPLPDRWALFLCPGTA